MPSKGTQETRDRLIKLFANEDSLRLFDRKNKIWPHAPESALCTATDFHHVLRNTKWAAGRGCLYIGYLHITAMGKLQKVVPQLLGRQVSFQQTRCVYRHPFLTHSHVVVEIYSLSPMPRKGDIVKFFPPCFVRKFHLLSVLAVGRHESCGYVYSNFSCT